MARLASAIHLVPTDGPAGRCGFTAAAVCSVTDTSPSLPVLLNRSASVYAAVRANGVLGVNGLAPEHRPLPAPFGGKTPIDKRFAGSPRLEGAGIDFDRRVAQASEVGGHTVLICEIVSVAGREGDEAPVCFNRAYRRLSPA